MTLQNEEHLEVNPWHQKGNPQVCLVYDDALAPEPSPIRSALGRKTPR